MSTTATVTDQSGIDWPSAAEGTALDFFAPPLGLLADAFESGTAGTDPVTGAVTSAVDGVKQDIESALPSWWKVALVIGLIVLGLIVVAYIEREALL